MSIETKHILLVSSPLYGHAIPLLQLGLKLTRFHHVTFAVSDTLVAGLGDEIKDLEFGPYGPVKLVGIKLTTGGDIIDLKAANPARQLFLGLFPVMREFFLTIPAKSDAVPKPAPLSFMLDGVLTMVDIVIADNFLGGPVSLLHERHVPYYLFNSARIWLAQAFVTLDTDDPESLKASTKIPPTFVRRSVGKKYLDINLDGNKDLLMDNCNTVHLADGIIVNSVRAAEETGLAEFLSIPTMSDMKLFCVGPLTPELANESPNQKLEETAIKKWLDDQGEGTVIYVSFGSIAVPAPEDIKEIGEALLQLQAPVIWSLKTAHYIHLPQEIRDGIGGQPAERRFLVVPWAPQKLILAHPSTGVFVSHCGWNSTLEALAAGVPTVGWPMFADQLINAEWLEGEGTGRVIRGTGMVRERVVPAEEIVSVLRDMMQPGGEDSEVRNSYIVAAKKWQVTIQAALAPGGSSSTELLELAHF